MEKKSATNKRKTKAISEKSFEEIDVEIKDKKSKKQSKNGKKNETEKIDHETGKVELKEKESTKSKAKSNDSGLSKPKKSEMKQSKLNLFMKQDRNIKFYRLKMVRGFLLG